jgi:hypothetical protein
MPKKRAGKSVRHSSAKAKPVGKRTSRTRRQIQPRSRRAVSLGQLSEPKSPMPAQHQQKPGLESKMTPRPRYLAPHYRGADKLAGKVAVDHWRRFRHRPRGRRIVRA